MDCKCTYFKLLEGKLVCTQCGKPSDKFNYDPTSARVTNSKKIEDKIDHKVETKQDKIREQTKERVKNFRASKKQS